MFYKIAVFLIAIFLIPLGAVLVSLHLLRENPVSTPAKTPAAITRLTHEPGNALRPIWSPDNRTLAFESNRENKFHIYVMNADGSNPRAVTAGANDDRHAAWMPDGKSILYDSFDGAHQEIWIVNVSDGSRKQLTRVDGLADYAAASPDGQRIAFYVYKDMTLNIWTARADGSDAKPLTRDLADARRHEPTMAWSRPGWSPDSQWIAYTGGDGRSIWMMRADGTDARSIIADDETNHFPWFLMDGRLAFITEYVPPRYGEAWTNLSVYDVKTGQRALLQEFMSLQEPIAWNVDLSKLVFSSPRAGQFDIYSIDLNAPGGMAALRGSLESLQSGKNNGAIQSNSAR